MTNKLKPMPRAAYGPIRACEPRRELTSPVMMAEKNIIDKIYEKSPKCQHLVFSFCVAISSLLFPAQ